MMCIREHVHVVQCYLFIVFLATPICAILVCLISFPSLVDPLVFEIAYLVPFLTICWVVLYEK